VIRCPRSYLDHGRSLGRLGQRWGRALEASTGSVLVATMCVGTTISVSRARPWPRQLAFGDYVSVVRTCFLATSTSSLTVDRWRQHELFLMAVMLLGLPKLCLADAAMEVLAPYNENLFGFFFAQARPLLKEGGCFPDIATRRSCCEAHESFCFPQAKEEGFTRFLCCDFLDDKGKDAGVVPALVYMSFEAAALGREAAIKVLPRVPQASCVFLEAGRLLAIHRRLERCGSRAFRGRAETPRLSTPKLRQCLASELSSGRLARELLRGNRSFQSLLPQEESGGSREVGGCWPSSHGGNWADMFAALHAAAETPATDPLAPIKATVQALNVCIWEVNQLRVAASEAWGRGPSSTIVPRFRPVAVPMAYPQTLHDDLEAGALGPHRGDVILRLLRSLEISRRPMARGLVFVELGIGWGALAAWLAVRVTGLVSSMHLVDRFHPDYNSQSSVMARLEAAMLRPCDWATDGEQWDHLDWTPSQLCGPAGLQVVVHRAFSAEAARAVSSGSVDLIFVDAGHVYPMVMGDLKAWWPKVAAGGVVAGHDFRYRVGDVRSAVVDFFQESDIFLDSDTVWWVLK